MEIMEVPKNDDGINYIWNTLAVDYIQRQLDDDDRTPAGMFNRIDRWLMGTDYYYCPVTDGKPMGLCYATYFSDFQIEGHISIFRQFWGTPTLEAAKLSIERVKADADYEQVILLLPETNRRIHGFADRLGYKKTGTIRGIYTRNGVDVPCSLMEALEWVH